MNNRLVWCDLAVQNLDRAAVFYSKVFQVDLQRMPMPDGEMAMFPFEPGAAAVSLRTDGIPSAEGALVYLDVGEDLDAALARVRDAGGAVKLGKTGLPGDHGFMACILDTEGNRVGLYSRTG